MRRRTARHGRTGRSAVAIACVLSLSVVAQLGWVHLRESPAAGRTSGPEAVSTRPNILLMIADDQTWSTFNRSLMPNVYSQIADQGVLFKDAYVNSSLCCPSRASMFSGLEATDSGVSANVDPLTRPTVVQALHDSGYRTLLAGKYLNSAPCSTVLPEFDDWYCYGEDTAAQTNPVVDVNGEYRPYTGYAADIFAGFVTHFIATTPASQPFFAIYSPKVPHEPTDDHRNDDLPVPTYRPPSFDEDTQHDGKPAQFQRGPLTDREISSIDADYDGMYRTSRSLDNAAGTILSSLGSRADNTLVIYLSDNGFLYGEHRIDQGKEVAYQPSVNVPMAIRFPKVRTTPEVSDALVQNTDIAPTIADAAGLPWNADGTSLLPLLKGSVARVRNAAIIERCVSSYGTACAPTGSTPYFIGMVTDTYKYVEYFTGERELYDLRTDPWELHNLAGSPGAAREQAKLAAQLAALRAPPPPVATIVTGPSGAISSDDPATFTYFSPAIAATYRCQLDRNGSLGDWKPCGYQTITLGPLPAGSYKFAVEAVGVDGEIGMPTALRAFTVAPQEPAVSVADGAVTEGNGTGAAISFVVSLNRAPKTAVTMQYETTDLTAASPDDYASESERCTSRRRRPSRPSSCRSSATSSTSRTRRSAFPCSGFTTPR
jgi:N-acetylglucosamine-6-sulfatase